MPAAQDDVSPLAGQRQLVLDKNLNAIQSGLDQIGSQHCEAALPGPDLGRWRGSSQPVTVLLRQGRHEGAIVDLGAQVSD